MRRVVVLSSLLVLAFGTAPAAATFRGRDGLLAVQPVRGSGVVLAKASGRVVRRLCGRRSMCGVRGPVTPRWSPDGRALALSPAGGPVPAAGVALVYPNGTCLDCHLIGGRMAAFTPSPAVVTEVRGGALIEYGVDGIQDGKPVAHGVVAGVWSSTGKLALERAGSLWAGHPRRLHRVGPGRQPSWSPAGDRLALVRNGWIVTVSLHDGATVRLVRGTSPAWSPDGRRIAFVGPGARVEVIRAAGGHPRTVGDVRGRSLDWQPVLPGAKRCVAPPGSVVVASSPDGLVTRRGMTAPFSTQSPAAYMGCQKSTGHARLLVRYEFESEDMETGATGAVTAGHYVALATFQTDFHYGGSSSALVVYDLHTGNPVGRLGGETLGCEGYSCETALNDLVINDSGFTAVHAVMSMPCTGQPSGNRCEQIQVSDDSGPRTIDAASTSVTTPFFDKTPVLTDLTLTGDTLTWQHSGSSETAQLH